MAEFFKKKLNNGLTVLFEPRKLDVVSVSASVNWGAAFEPGHSKGISHFIEHLMFKGTKTRDQEEIAREIEKKGGILNAYTSEEVTSYWCKLPSKHVSSGIEIASDLILNPRFDSEEFEKEKQVIIEEIKMYHDNPRYYVMDKIKGLLYKKPFGMSIAGKAEIVRGLTMERVIDLFKSKYTSDSMILSVVGNADFDEICKKAEKIFPKTQRKIIEHAPVRMNSQESESRAGIDQTHFVFGFHAPSLKDRERYAYEVMAAYLFAGMSSRLWQEIREKRGLVYSINGDFDLGSRYGYCAIYAGTRKEKVREIKQIILEEIKKLKEVSARDIEECKEQVIGVKKIAEEDSSSAMNSIMLEEVAGGAEEYYKHEENIIGVGPDEIRKLACLKNYSSFALVPK
ncbi:MAG: insulinase family protein [Nanoarchaeota archaeon]|nr:insulinase family protein [Nanoarchaeota archaeon]MBU4086831.1 insulinase family protein [Nanoarchaeota archaeon]